MSAYHHQVLFRFKEPLAPETAHDLTETLLALPAEIAGILDISAGINETEETLNSHGYTLGLHVSFESRQALRAYQPHPAHQAFIQKLNGLVESVVVMDYPVPDREPAI